MKTKKRSFGNNNTLIKSAERDTNFLQRVNVMDYSLLVGWDKNQRKIVYGIIDYLVQFDYLKKLEFASNSVRWNLHLRSLPPTVIPPIAYAKRLRGFVRQNFRTIRATNEGERSPE
ncbi:hypothetical protein POM88_042067 [Heracleum sosnowskyi]|uniref:PIPK domain-containing protein n=1 Tax=Heracleum sosnowskyi TaxID=360622 RepID=A0AAD8HHB5_9APIA|nr:hypothetical protein POM88_042067 [Heracleum sosnowskyi]